MFLINLKINSNKLIFILILTTALTYVKLVLLGVFMQRKWTINFTVEDITNFYNSLKQIKTWQNLGDFMGVGCTTDEISMFLGNAVMYMNDYKLIACWRTVLDERFNEKEEKELNKLWASFVKDKLVTNKQKQEYNEESIIFAEEAKIIE